MAGGAKTGRLRARKSAWTVLAGIVALCALAVPQTGAEDYIGGGQAADVNAFLNPEVLVVRNSFGQELIRVPIVKATTLVPLDPSGTTAEMEFKFSNADFTTFAVVIGKLRLQTTDVTSEGGKAQGIVVTSGRTTVVASITGTKPSGQRARDSDHITLICCVPETEQPPTADAGTDFSIGSGMTATLSGGGTDPNDDPLTFQWEQVSGPAVSLSGANTANPTFSLVVPIGQPNQELEFELVVNDGIWTSFPDRVKVTVIAGVNQTPTAVAGPDQIVTSGDPVTLDGSASSDPEDLLNVTCEWTQFDGPTVTLSNPNSCITTFIAPAVNIGTNLGFTLTVRDTVPGSTSATDSMNVFVNPPNRAPTANAGLDQTATEGSVVTLDGSGSSDPDLTDTLSFAWVQTAGPHVNLTLADTANPRFIAPTVNIQAILTFELTVTDTGGLSSSDPVDVTVVDSATGALTGLSLTSETGFTRRSR